MTRGARGVKTVGQLIDTLQKLPRNLKLMTGFSKYLEVYVVKQIRGSRYTLKCDITEPGEYGD